MAKRKRVKKKARRMATFISVVLITIIGITISKVVLEIVDKYKEKNDLENKLVSLQEKEEELENDVNKLKDPEYLARYAREKYFYSKDGELIIRIPEDKK